MKKSAIIATLIFSTAIIGTGVYLGFNDSVPPKGQDGGTAMPTDIPPSTDQAKETATPTETADIAPKQDLEQTKQTVAKHSVPFILQAPGAKWGNPIFQDGCEEASMLMAIAWIRGTKSVSPTTAADDITKLAAFEVGRFGHHEDIDVSEILTVLREYFQYDQAKLLENTTLDDLKTQFADGNIILTPTYGAALGNPNFKAPGPVTHMLVLTGYDPKTDEFIVNDPGTRRGQNYRYKASVLFDAIWAFPPGAKHPPAPASASRKKSVIVIHPYS
ncbi:MAG: C39 family peptidase [Candidatus Moraniibacteriota bacterium]